MPDALDPVVFNLLPVRRGVGFASAAVEVALAHLFRKKPGATGHAIEDFLDDEHALRSAEATESGVRGEVSLRDRATESDVLYII